MRFTRCYSAICFLRQGEVFPSACAERFSRRRAPRQCEEVDASTRSPVGTRFTKFHAPPKPHGPGWFWSTPRFDFFHVFSRSLFTPLSYLIEGRFEPDTGSMRTRSLHMTRPSSTKHRVSRFAHRFGLTEMCGKPAQKKVRLSSGSWTSRKNSIWSNMPCVA